MHTRWRSALVVACALALPGLARGASAPAVEGRNGMVVSSQALASQVGADILAAGAEPCKAPFATPAEAGV